MICAFVMSYFSTCSYHSFSRKTYELNNVDIFITVLQET